MAVYSREMKKIKENIEEAMTRIGEEKIIIGGDFNARTRRFAYKRRMEGKGMEKFER